MTLRGLVGTAFAVVLALSASAQSEDGPMARILSFSDLLGWESDTHQDALEVFLNTCDRIKGREWPQVCALAQQQSNAKTFFELFFRPVLIEDTAPPLFTGYFEPELSGSRVRTPTYRHPVYAMPRDRAVRSPYFTRQDIGQGALSNRGLEIAWVDNAVELFFLQVQGSGRIKLTNGTTIRVGYAGHNGHNYSSIGQELVRRGVYTEHQVSAQVIKNWVKRNPIEGQSLLYSNPSYVFFKERKRLKASAGPIGAMSRSITPMRSIAVDPGFVTLGAPVWVEKDGQAPLRRLMIAQDTGSAIKGAQRADIFYGTGDQAGDVAGRIRDTGRMIVLMPIQLAYGLEEKSEQ
ncbi:murein transglycosylase A [Pacificibacter marinus]|uniref:peptidoglycan lytic exotransglycosylase n=1 Tax=Pacificibacter marinus TaxID=658057 RepID=A0A1Y5SZ01_9RHOB|nr:MltA domain-containing protein [Pacificibacter marinus]SEL03827.1 membrane-bound lytic murein transglycosylase A [Pacificibacter marinus]SLN51920.1 Membrane-bound lytic murein transglycosylase A precursor [Pacificibacter marinus]